LLPHMEKGKAKICQERRKRGLRNNKRGFATRETSEQSERGSHKGKVAILDQEEKSNALICGITKGAIGKITNS